VGVSGHNRGANCLEEPRGVLGEDVREFLEELHVATDTFENSVTVQQLVWLIAHEELIVSPGRKLYGRRAANG
jgi:hypothetical protein